MNCRELNKITGRIFDIQRYSIHDGPGIRTIVFLKGCNLRCRWCCNPESQSCDIQKMQVGGIEKIIGRDVTAGEVIDEVMKDAVYYRHSGGGLTLSGGEALLQPEFASALLQMAKYHGLGTAIESTADADFNMIEEKILPYLDFFLMDIKHLDGEKHLLFTGKSNDKMLENAKKIASTGQKLVIRVPVVPTFNDTPEEIRDIANFVKGLPNVTEIHLLPYHRLGYDKYVGLNRKYTLEDLVPPSGSCMALLMQTVKTVGLDVQIGG